jgi:hypothetical protein
MRGYTSISISELKAWLDDGEISILNLYAPTDDFVSANPDLDEEEIEFTLTALAAEDALMVVDEKYPLVAALEIPSEEIATTSDGVIGLNSKAKWGYLECIFQVEDAGEELTWFATQEISEQLKIWLA